MQSAYCTPDDVLLCQGAVKRDFSKHFVWNVALIHSFSAESITVEYRHTKEADAKKNALSEANKQFFPDYLCTKFSLQKAYVKHGNLICTIRMNFDDKAIFWANNICCNLVCQQQRK